MASQADQFSKANRQSSNGKVQTGDALRVGEADSNFRIRPSARRNLQVDLVQTGKARGEAGIEDVGSVDSGATEPDLERLLFQYCGLLRHLRVFCGGHGLAEAGGVEEHNIACAGGSVRSHEGDIL